MWWHTEWCAVRWGDVPKNPRSPGQCLWCLVVYEGARTLKVWTMLGWATCVVEDGNEVSEDKGGSAGATIQV